MRNPAKMLPVLAYLQKSVNGVAGMSPQTLMAAADDVVKALNVSFNHARQQRFSLRMSNIGKPYCQLWMEKNRPEDRTPLVPSDVIKFTIGDIVEAVIKAVLKEAFPEESYTDAAKHELVIGGKHIKGTSDLQLDGAVYDVKSASKWAYEHKFEDVQTLVQHDNFGYVAQLVAYAKSDGLNVGGWIVYNKETGEIKFIDCDLSESQIETIWAEIEAKIEKLESGAPFERSFTDVAEKFRGKETGNRILGRDTPCVFCDFLESCWPEAVERPSIPSNAKNPAKVMYTYIAEDSDDS